MNRAAQTSLWLTALALLAACHSDSAAPVRPADAGHVVVFTTLSDEVVGPIFDAYKQETGVTVLSASGNFEALSHEIHNPGGDPVADLFIVANGADLRLAVEQGIFRPTTTPIIEQIVMPELRDPEGFWVSLATEFRPVIYHRDLVNEEELASIANYASLADAGWHGRLCMSSASLAGNRSLLALLIDTGDVRSTELLVRRWLQNVTGGIVADDSKLLQSLEEGQCAVGIAGSSSIARYQQQYPDTRLAPFWFSATDDTLIDAIGAGVTRHASNAEHGVALLEWLLAERPNEWLAARMAHFPVNSRAKVNPALTAWSGESLNRVSIASLGFLLDDADKLAERARYR